MQSPSCTFAFAPQCSLSTYSGSGTTLGADTSCSDGENTTTHQIKMFLTRLGMGAKMIITGDMTQIDLPHSVQSGLVQATNILRDVPGIGKVEFDKKDIVRHQLVQRIVEAYEKHDEHIRALRKAEKEAAKETPKTDNKIQ